MKNLAFFFALIGWTISVVGQVQPNYELAARFSPEKMKTLVFSTSVEPHWLKGTPQFWYSYTTTQGTFYYMVNPSLREKRKLFDNIQLAASMSRLTGDPFDDRHLFIQKLELTKDQAQIRFDVTSKLVEEEEDLSELDQEEREKRKGKPKMVAKVWHFLYDLKNGQLQLDTLYKKPKDDPEWASVSPDESYVLFVKDHNIFKMDMENYAKALENEKDSTIVESQLTTDGEAFYSYAANDTGRGVTNTDKKKDREAVRVIWSADGATFALVRTDYRKVSDLWVINSVATPRPTLETYKYHMPGEDNSPQEKIHVFTQKGEQKIEVEAPAFKDQTLSLISQMPLPSSRDDKRKPRIFLEETGKEIYFYRTSRDLKRIDLCRVNSATGEIQTVIEERLNTYVETRNPWLINATGEIVHWSERDGWAHFYLYDKNGKLIRQITQGPWHNERILHVDETARVMFLVANGKEAEEDPYYEHTYRINLDGSGLRLLDPGNYDHKSDINDSGIYFVSNYSRVNSEPTSVLRDREGRKLMDLETADLSNLMGQGYRFPEPFIVKAGDGITDLYGVMYKPFDFDSTQQYPIIAYVYPGPQTEAVNKAFSSSMDRTDRLAQMGFVVITIGNRGGHPSRSKWYHNFGYGNLRDYGLEDKKVAVEQLAARHDFIDLDKVGIFGHSGGGFMSTAAMLVYPDFFKVAVSSAGNHENNIYNRWWSEKHHGVKEKTDAEGNVTFEYAIQKNSELAKNLKGKLLICTGDIDNNVHPANTIRLADALIKANKRFDFFIFPGQRHGFGNMNEYFFWMKANYFAEHLLEKSSKSVDVLEMQREKPNR